MQKSPNNAIFSKKTQANFGQKGQKRGALNPNSVLCTNHAPSTGFCALNPGSALNPGTNALRYYATMCWRFRFNSDSLYYWA